MPDGTPGERDIVPGISGEGANAPSFFDNNLRRSYLADVPAALSGGVVPNGTEFPATPSTGQLFFRTDTSKLYIYSGASWLQIGLMNTSGNLKIPGRYLKE